ncbi:hypothetical protein B0H11DRAFT_1916457 [Mycena galericulata]|nr:hypothetical protein B0H11DRAFT_1916457 [Mycena galericulata]
MRTSRYFMGERIYSTALVRTQNPHKTCQETTAATTPMPLILGTDRQPAVDTTLPVPNGSANTTPNISCARKAGEMETSEIQISSTRTNLLQADPKENETSSNIPQTCTGVTTTEERRGPRVAKPDELALA